MILLRKQYLEGEILDGKEAYPHTKSTLKTLNRPHSMGKYVVFCIVSHVGKVLFELFNFVVNSGVMAPEPEMIVQKSLLGFQKKSLNR